jgi:hypothetical protein
MYSEICGRIDTQKAQIEKRKDNENKRRQIKEGQKGKDSETI